MAATPTKRIRCGKVCFALLAISLANVAAAGPAHPLPVSELRECVGRATSAAAVALCEKNHQVTLKTSIEQLAATIRARLDARQRILFEHSASAWQAFLERESALLDLSLGLRKDGLGPSLRPGAINRLYEQREQQLREHLHNLSLAVPGGGASGR